MVKLKKKKVLILHNYKIRPVNTNVIHFGLSPVQNLYVLDLDWHRYYFGYKIINTRCEQYNKTSLLVMEST